MGFLVSEYVDPNWETSEADAKLSGYVETVKNGIRPVEFRNLPDSECSHLIERMFLPRQ